MKSCVRPSSKRILCKQPGHKREDGINLPKQEGVTLPKDWHDGCGECYSDPNQILTWSNLSVCMNTKYRSNNTHKAGDMHSREETHKVKNQNDQCGCIQNP
mmetsp:Transcript_8149/g.11698  ORF Transcript_8149/g.11698 Transcript_8149/m.11698 type:complete len:101 (+) Transcript_8149:258-560(+)